MPEQKFDYKKEYKDLYLPKKTPMLIDVPKMTFLAIDGKGDPNGEEYARALEALYALSYTIKMSYKGDHRIDGYFQYVVPPLEGLWWLTDHIPDTAATDLGDRDEWLWTSMIRQPEFVDKDTLEWAKGVAAIKKPEVDTSKVSLFTFAEGLCVQILHMGPFATEPESLALMQEFMAENGIIDEVGNDRKHHEIYLTDPRKVAPEKNKTVLRHPVRKEMNR